ncbi:protein NRT1/ PTR FAMILY 8.3-like [Aegilops tauschii subsp. strangulata]|nr:protein NRT1/ PTR FAMILY 8.3-like [Aegilops tauschii subsp. strangulata]
MRLDCEAIAGLPCLEEALDCFRESIFQQPEHNMSEMLSMMKPLPQDANYPKEFSVKDLEYLPRTIYHILRLTLWPVKGYSAEAKLEGAMKTLVFYILHGIRFNSQDFFIRQLAASGIDLFGLKIYAPWFKFIAHQPKIDSPQPKIAHTSDFKFLDKAAIVTQLGMEERLEAATSWKLCTVTQVEEVKILLRLLPVRITIVIVSSAFSQMNTTFVQQGSAMEMTILSVPVPAASLASLEVICVMTWVILYNKVIVPALRSFSLVGDGEPSQQQQRMGAGRLLMTLTMAVAALVEMKRLDSAARGVEISISWQLPQYFFLAGGEVFCYIVQLEFFFDKAPDTMKSMCTSLALLTIALGSYMSSFIYAIVEAFTATGDSPGWISDDLNKGHLDYFFWAMAAMCTLNFVVYSGIVKNYRLKTIIS